MRPFTPSYSENDHTLVSNIPQSLAISSPSSTCSFLSDLSSTLVPQSASLISQFYLPLVRVVDSLFVQLLAFVLLCSESPYRLQQVYLTVPSFLGSFFSKVGLMNLTIKKVGLKAFAC